MSRFIDKLKQVSEAVSPPLGFRSAKSISVKPRIQLVASLSQADADSLVDWVGGADAGILRISKLGSGIKAFRKISQAVPEVAWGAWLEGSEEGGTEQMVNAGGDFVVFAAAGTPLKIFQNIEVGKILEIEPSLSDGLLRAVNELPVDAVLMAGEKGEGFSLTWHHLMLFQRTAGLLTKPLLVSLPANVTAVELQAIWEAGAAGVVIEVKAGRADSFKELRQAIDKLNFPARRRKKAEPLLPYVSEEREIEKVEEEEE